MTKDFPQRKRPHPITVDLRDTHDNMNPVVLNKEFVSLTEEFAEYLLKIKGALDQYDRTAPSKEARIEKVRAEKSKIFSIFNKHFEAIWEIAQNFSEEEYKTHQKYYQNKLLPMVSTPPLNKRIYEKPLGYPGDFIMMNYYYGDSYEGTTSYDILFHRYTLELPLSRAHMNRKPYLINKLRALLDLNREVRIASFGCGPALEALEFIRTSAPLGKMVFTFVDAEPKALEQIQSALAAIETSDKYEAKFLSLNLIKLIRRSGVYEELRGQDFIYAAGLFDYFDEKIAKKILCALYSLLAENGTLIVVNVRKGHNYKAYMEMLGEWYLHLRDEKDMLSLADGIDESALRTIERDQETGENLYLVIKKRHGD